MWRKVIGGCALRQPWCMIAGRSAASKANVNIDSAVDSILLHSLKKHYLEVSKMTPPPKVSPPSPFTIEIGGLKDNGPALKRKYGEEEISIHAMRLAQVVDVEGGDDEDDGINQLFLHVDISKPGRTDSLQFLCGLYPDALGIHSVKMRPKIENSEFPVFPNKYVGPEFGDLDEKLRDELHSYIDERGVNESLFPYLQAWVYVKDHRNLMLWFKQLGTFIKEKTLSKDAGSP